MHSQRVRDTPLIPWIIADTSGTVHTGHCNCMAGLGETCSHIGALLFALECYVRQRETKTVTQEKAYWMVPPTREVAYLPVAEIDFTSASTKKKNMDLLIESGVQHCNSPGKKADMKAPSEGEINCFFHNLSKTEGQPAILSIVDDYSDNFVPKSLNKESFPKVLTELYSQECTGMNFTELHQKCSKIELTVTQKQANNVEKETQQQSNCKAWYRFRAGRVTASNLKNACHTSLVNPSLSLIKSICYPEITSKFANAATNWGKDKESVALKTYMEYMKSRHCDVEVSSSGFVIHIDYPHLGASPDGLISCSCCKGEGCIEIKCPYSARDCSVAEAAADKDFCLSDVNGELHLKADHSYYYQVQAQIFITKRDYCDFVVWTLKDMTVERIFPDRTFWDKAVEKATLFFNVGILPELVAKHYTTSVSLLPSRQKIVRSN